MQIWELYCSGQVAYYDWIVEVTRMEGEWGWYDMNLTKKIDM